MRCPRRSSLLVMGSRSASIATCCSPCSCVTRSSNACTRASRSAGTTVRVSSPDAWARAGGRALVARGAGARETCGSPCARFPARSATGRSTEALRPPAPASPSTRSTPRFKRSPWSGRKDRPAHASSDCRAVQLALDPAHQRLRAAGRLRHLALRVALLAQLQKLVGEAVLHRARPWPVAARHAAEAERLPGCSAGRSPNQAA